MTILTAAASCTTPLLGPGDPVIHAYGDGSFTTIELSIGAWAYSVPAFGLEVTRVESASSVEYFEFSAVAQSIIAIQAIDRTGRTICVYTDSTFVIAAMQHVNSGVLPPRKSYDRLRAAFSTLTNIVNGRRIECQLADVLSGPHRACHNGAVRAVREHIRTNRDVVQSVLLRKERRQLKELIQRRCKLEADLLRVETQIVQAELVIAKMG